MVNGKKVGRNCPRMQIWQIKGLDNIKYYLRDKEINIWGKYSYNGRTGNWSSGLLHNKGALSTIAPKKFPVHVKMVPYHILIERTSQNGLRFVTVLKTKGHHTQLIQKSLEVISFPVISILFQFIWGSRRFISCFYLSWRGNKATWVVPSMKEEKNREKKSVILCLHVNVLLRQMNSSVLSFKAPAAADIIRSGVQHALMQNECLPQPFLLSTPDHSLSLEHSLCFLPLLFFLTMLTFFLELFDVQCSSQGPLPQSRRNAAQEVCCLLVCQAQAWERTLYAEAKLRSRKNGTRKCYKSEVLGKAIPRGESASKLHVWVLAEVARYWVLPTIGPWRTWVLESCLRCRSLALGKQCWGAGRTGSIICRTQCNMKMWGFVFIIKNFKMVGCLGGWVG